MRALICHPPLTASVSPAGTRTETCWFFVMNCPKWRRAKGAAANFKDAGCRIPRHRVGMALHGASGRAQRTAPLWKECWQARHADGCSPRVPKDNTVHLTPLATKSDSQLRGRVRPSYTLRNQRKRSRLATTLVALRRIGALRYPRMTGS